jgi:CRISPR system Cascade subunit CasE
MSVWLTSIALDTRNAAVRRDLGNVDNLHRRVMSLIPDGLGPNARQQAGVLYRLEVSLNRPRLLVQSLVEPDLGRLPVGYGHPRAGKLDPLLDALRPGLAVHYRIAANTSLRRPRGWTGPGRPGQVAALRGAAAEEWWRKRAAGAGLALRSALARPLPDAQGRRDGAPLRHAITQFDGVAVVQDAEALRTAVRKGIGRGKSHGCGLLSLLVGARI